MMMTMMKKQDKEIGERLQELRKTHKYTQKQVAHYLGISQPTYSRIETGNRRLSCLSTLLKLCTLYDCTEEYILCETNKYVPMEWVGITKDTDLEIIGQANQTMRYLKLLRNIEKNI